MQAKVFLLCSECRKPFVRPLYQVKRGQWAYCSKKCRWTWNSYRVENGIAYLELLDGKRNFVAEALIDEADIPIASDGGHRWGAKWTPLTGSYYVTSMKDRHLISLHRVLMGEPEGLEVDHVNGNPLDNRRENLRVVNRYQNQQNKAPRRDSASGIRNVHWDKARGKWVVSLMVEHKKIHIGYFHAVYDAEQAAIEARRKYMTHSRL